MTTALAPEKQPRASGPLWSAGLAIAGAVIAVGAWWLAIIVFEIESFLVPAPPQVAEALAREWVYLLENAAITLSETGQGFGWSVLIGIGVGALLAGSSLIERAFMPTLVALNAVPKLAFAPLLVVWLGFDQGPKVILVVLMCAFPIILSTAAGLSSTPADLAELARSLSASRMQTFYRIRLPGALPQVFVGLKVAMPLAVIGALVGELFGSSEGLGFVIQNSGSDIGLGFAAIALLAVMSIVLFYLVVMIERLALPWVKGTTG
ncbi:ABC transporter permease [Actinoplanes sp. NPDC051470]|uniref:ABC transporter permease n=1 Tax=Actinoplanes sp. NPDC051470 TaxID=3157224 RepID=UPI0034429C0B